MAHRITRKSRPTNSSYQRYKANSPYRPLSAGGKTPKPGIWWKFSLGQTSKSFAVRCSQNPHSKSMTGNFFNTWIFQKKEVGGGKRWGGEAEREGQTGKRKKKKKVKTASAQKLQRRHYWEPEQFRRTRDVMISCLHQPINPGNREPPTWDPWYLSTLSSSGSALVPPVTTFQCQLSWWLFLDLGVAHCIFITTYEQKHIYVLYIF